MDNYDSQSNPAVQLAMTIKVDSNIYSRFDLEEIRVHHRRMSGRLKESWITYGVNEVFKRHRIIGGIIYRGDWVDRRTGKYCTLYPNPWSAHALGRDIAAEIEKLLD